MMVFCPELVMVVVFAFCVFRNNTQLGLCFSPQRVSLRGGDLPVVRVAVGDSFSTVLLPAPPLVLVVAEPSLVGWE